MAVHHWQMPDIPRCCGVGGSESLQDKDDFVQTSAILMYSLNVVCATLHLYAARMSSS
ncbi:hypothetical protein DAEQUDRAFT_337896 [Daedalea quercina L-15889]|uniref:Uncharacterized protein n=1 Tax=Daedalea quercina L-15889 TaxID=1314783 RepID=A0A165PJI0_9APHY|nr:hypothetical protein DAEQUDRAFT_337896 [Daedalea quercina L-15889]